MSIFTVPAKDEVSGATKKYFDYSDNRLDMMPNLYAMLAHSVSALESHFTLQSRKQVLNLQEREVISLVVAR